MRYWHVIELTFQFQHQLEFQSWIALNSQWYSKDERLQKAQISCVISAGVSWPKCRQMAAQCGDVLRCHGSGRATARWRSTCALTDSRRSAGEFCWWVETMTTSITIWNKSSKYSYQMQIFHNFGILVKGVGGPESFMEYSIITYLLLESN